VKLEGVQSASGAWSGYVLVTAVPAVGPAALPFNASADAVAAPPTCARGGQTVAWRVALAGTARVAVTACGAGSARSASGGGRTIFAATVAVAPAATVRVRLSLGPAGGGGGGMAASAFTPAVRAGFVAAVARRLGVDALRVEFVQARCAAPQPHRLPPDLRRAATKSAIRWHFKECAQAQTKWAGASLSGVGRYLPE
jgi:hypothetical protein